METSSNAPAIPVARAARPIPRHVGTVARMQLLAGFEVRWGDVVLDLKPASQRLLAYLALTGRSVERAHTAYRLWPDKSEERAMANLRSALWRLRDQPVELVVTSTTKVRLSEAVWVDARDGVDELRRAPAEAVLAPGQDLLAPDADLLPEWYDDWLLIERERLRQVRLAILEELCSCLVHERRWTAAIELGLGIAALEPLRESAHRLVIEAHLGQGNMGEARRQLMVCRALLDKELGVAPSPGLCALVQGPEAVAHGARC